MTNKVRKALEKVQYFLDSSKRKQKKKRKAILEKLQLLRKRKKAIKRKLAGKLSDKEVQQLSEELSLITSKRRKALEVLKELRSGEQDT